MSRTSVTIDMKNKDTDKALYIINQLMQQNGYSAKIVKGEDVWAKGDGVLQVMQCFAAVFSDNALILQAWIKDAIAGEADINPSFIAGLPKKKMRKILEEIQNKLYQI